VFDGSQTTPYSETDLTNPQSVYGKTKLAGEDAIRVVGGNYLILRTSWVYGVHGGNFVKTILRLAQERSELRIVADQFGAPTWARLLANSTVQILRCWQQQDFNQNLSGLYHLTTAGRTNWHQYAEEIVRLARQYDAALANKPLVIKPIATHDYPLPAKRPENSTLATGKITAAFGLDLPTWQDDLSACMRLLYASATPD
jgi:dTDP-4-dehydrorhamnose reductase